MRLPPALVPALAVALAVVAALADRALVGQAKAARDAAIHDVDSLRTILEVIGPAPGGAVRARVREHRVFGGLRMAALRPGAAVIR
jgi:hypothetical protein